MLMVARRYYIRPTSGPRPSVRHRPTHCWMSLVRATAPELLRPVEINDLALNTTLYYAANLSFTALDIGLSSVLFGASL